MTPTFVEHGSPSARMMHPLYLCHFKKEWRDEIAIMPSVTLKRLTVTGVEYVVVDEDSPLLPKRSDVEERGMRDTKSDGMMASCSSRRYLMMIACLGIACALGVVGLIPVTCSHWSRIARGEREIPTLDVAVEEMEEANGMLFQRARVRVPENLKNFPSFWNYAGRGPINVTYDERSIMLNGERALFLSGSLHPARATKATWASALNNAVRQGLNMVTIYVFWGAHQPFPDMDFDWSFPGSWDLASAIRAAANRGLFVHVRPGPYACAEYNFGGIPEWVPLNQPDMVMRRYNQEWMDAMETYVVGIVGYLTKEKLFAHQGGPIILSQIENELGGDDNTAHNARFLKVSHHGKALPHHRHQLGTIQDYADWCGDLTARLAPKVVWTMCNGLTAPNTMNTCNGGSECSTSWLESHGQTGRIQVDQPALWTEHEQGFQMWGEESFNQSGYFWGSTARDMTREGLQWFARGGAHLNYYMWWGGYNRGRAAASGIMNVYASDACLCSSGQLRQPKYGHFQDFHNAIIAVAPILLNCETALDKSQSVEYKTDGGVWKVGSKQRIFAYRLGAKDDDATNLSFQPVSEVIFLENDDGENVEVRLPISSDGTQQIIRMNPYSAILLSGGTVLFDSSNVIARHKGYRRHTVPNAVKLLDWQTWSESIGADSSDRRTVVSSRPIEQTSLLIKSRTVSDYAWYETDIALRRELRNATIQIETQKANAFSVFLDGRFVQAVDNHEHAEGDITFSVSVGTISAGNHRLAFLSESLGYLNLIGRWGGGTTEKTKGITGDVVILGRIDTPHQQSFSQSLVDGREWRSFPGLHGGTRRKRQLWPDKLQFRRPVMMPNACSWSSVLFDSPSYDPSIQGLFLDVTSGRGHILLNGYDLGRFWNITRGASTKYSQRYYFLPNELLFSNGTLNELTLFKAVGGENSSETNLVLSWLEMDEESSMEDEVDFPSACI